MDFHFEEFPIIETERLILREMQITDAPALLALLSDPEVVRYLDISALQHQEQAEKMIEHFHSKFQTKERFRWTITLKGEYALIGTCGFVSWNKAWRCAEIGYDLAPAYWGKGIMTEALQAMLQYGGKSMELHRAEAEVMPENQSSAALLRKLGFQHEGTIRQRAFWKDAYHDLDLFGLLYDTDMVKRS